MLQRLRAAYVRASFDKRYEVAVVTVFLAAMIFACFL